MLFYVREFEIEPYLEIFKRSKAYDTAVKKLIAKHEIEFEMILEGCKKETHEF